MEMVKKKLVIGFSERSDWEGKLGSVLRALVKLVGLQLSDEEQSRLATLPAGVANLIYAGVLHLVVLEFGGESCEVELVYYPGEDEQDDVDLSLFEVVDWDVDSLNVRVLVEDLAYAQVIAGPALENLSSEKLTVRLEGADAGEAGSADDTDEEPRTGNVDEEDEEQNGKEAE